jgi:hypothetical protein
MLIGNCFCASEALVWSLKPEAGVIMTEMCKVELESQSPFISKFGRATHFEMVGTASRRAVNIPS